MGLPDQPLAALQQRLGYEFRDQALLVEALTHPSYAQGYYDRDNDFYMAWGNISSTPESLRKYLDEHVHGVSGRAEYMAKQPGLAERIKADRQVCTGVNYGF